LADTKPSLIEYAGIKDGRDYTRGFVGAIHKWLPSQDSLLEQKSGGDLELYELVAQDDQVKSCLQQRFRALLAKDWEVIPGGEKRIDKQAAEHLEKQLEAIDWDAINEKMLFGIHYGYSAAEVLWKREDDKVGIEAIKVRNRRRFHFNADQQLVLKTMQNPLGEALPERKFWHFCTGADHDDEPYGRGLGHWLYWPTFFKRNGVRWWLKFIEKYAKPTRLGKYPTGATQGEKDVLWNALDSFGDDDRSMIPEGLEMLFLESARSGTVDYKALCDQMDGAIAKIILSQTMTTDDGSSLSQASVHESVKDEVIESDSDLLCESFNNSVAVWLTDWNYPGAAYPKVRRKIQVDPDPATMADTDIKLQGLGISLKPAAIAAKYGEDYLIPDNADSIPQLNGEQVNALVSIITNAKQGGWSAELVAGMINGAFPNWPDDAVAAITKNLGDPTGGDGQVPDPNSQTPIPDPNTPTPPAQSLDDVAAQFSSSPPKKKNCKAGLSCGFTCISKTKQCIREMSIEDRYALKAIKKMMRQKQPETFHPLMKIVNKLRSIDFGDPSALFGNNDAQGLKIMYEIKDFLRNSGMTKAEARSLAQSIQAPRLSKNFTSEDKKFLERDVSEFFQITNGVGKNLIETFVRKEKRASQNSVTKTIDVGKKPNGTIIFHEMGHAFEVDLGWGQKGIDWVKSRATGEQESLNKLSKTDKYRDTEKAYPDHFASNYVGKVYNDGTDFAATEVLSTGLEAFYTVTGMLGLWKADKKQFEYTISALIEARKNV
jgi:phage gp29-like protein